MSAAAPPDLHEHVAEMHREAGGLLRVWFFDPHEGVHLLLAAALGDPWSRGMLAAVGDCARHITEAPTGRPVLCLCCPAPIRTARGVTFAVAVPETEGAQHALGSAICPACAAREGLGQRTLVGLRRLWPDLREIRPMHGPERAQ